MRLHSLLESTTPENLVEDRIDIELSEDFAIEGKILEFTEDGGIIIELDDQAAELVDLDEEVLNEFIPLALAAAGLGMTAYDAYRNYRAYKRGDISKADLAKRVGTDAAIGLVSGGVGKLATKAFQGAKAGVSALKNRQAATAVTSKADDVATTTARTATPTPTKATPTKVTTAPAATAATRKADDVATTTARRADDAPATAGRRSSRLGRAARRFTRGARRAALGGRYGGQIDYDNPLQRGVQNIMASEGAMSDIHARISSADDPAEEIYKMMNDFNSPEGEYIRREYEITAGENGLHGDDDMETIIDIMVDDMELNEAEYQGRNVKLNKPMAGDVKKFKVYVKNPKGNVVKVNFGQKGVKIKKSNPKRRKSFRARHNCDNPGPKHKARYWSCRKW